MINSTQHNNKYSQNKIECKKIIVIEEPRIEEKYK